jgi:hypothetical protein
VRREARSVATHAQGLPYDDLPYEPYEERADEEWLDDEPASTGMWELVSLLVLVIAGAGLPGIGWLTGIAMVHQSRVWTGRDTWIAVLGPLPVVAAVAVWAASGDQALLLNFGPLPVVLVFGGAIAGLLGGAYLTVRAFVLA